jgi:O-antigen/teichoic acid export membrane protein
LTEPRGSIVASPGPTVDSERAGEPSGRERLSRNLLVSWTGQLVFIAAGFFLPRMIGDHLGSDGLGVWDLGWSIVSYFGLAQLGINSATDPYVARYRAVGDHRGLNRAMSSALCLQLVVASVVFLVTALASLHVPALLSGSRVSLIGDAQWVVAMLGASVGVQIAFNTFDGVICGCHRWDLHNAIDAGSYAVIVMAMVASLWLHGGLATLAAVYLCGVFGAELVRVAVARRVCPELRVRWQAVDWQEMRGMFAFGGKVFVGAIASRLMYQTASILIAGYLGPATLALYSRPMALVQHLATFVSKLGSMMTPIASQMAASGRRHELAELVVESSRYSALIALPAATLLMILGGPLLEFWMGPTYAQPLLLTILTAGHVVSMGHRPVNGILVGIGWHGTATLIALVASLTCVGFNVVALDVFHMGLPGVALAISLCLLVSDGIVIPAYACRRLGIALHRFLLTVWARPLLYTIPGGAWALTARLFLPSLASLIVGGIGSSIIIALCYWRWALSPSQRASLRAYLAHVALFTTTRVRDVS